MNENRDPIRSIVKTIKIGKFLIPILPAIFIFFTIVIIMLIVISPIIKGGDMISNVLGVTQGFWNRVTNTLSLECLFCSDQTLNAKKEKKFYEKIEKLNDTYIRGKGMDGKTIQLDIPLLLSTVFYNDDFENSMFINSEAEEDLDEVTEGDTFGNLSWYPDIGDQKSIEWFKGSTEAEGCYIVGYHYVTTPHISIGKMSKLRMLAKHMVKRSVNGTCTAQHDEEGNFTGWSTREWYEWSLDVDEKDKLYTMEFDQNPYPKYRSKEQAEQVPSTYVTYLMANFLPTEYKKQLPKAVKDLSEKHEEYLSKRKSMKKDIYLFKDGYEYLVKGLNKNVCAVANGNCSYKTKVKGGEIQTISNIKVQLLQCKDGVQGQPIPGEELVDFEKYITGVTYAENGAAPLESLKAQAIAARSWVLTRGGAMGTKYLQIYQKDGQWIIPIRNCQSDQVYCDPDKGCSWNGNNGTVHSGTTTKPGHSKPPIDADSDIRKAVSETTGQVLTLNGNIFVASYTNVRQNKWTAAAKAGKDAYQALVSTYDEGAQLKLESSCTGNTSTGSVANSGNLAYYNQNDYAAVPYCTNGATVKSSGCLPTAFSMVVQNLTGRVTTPKEMAEYICNDTNGSRKYRVTGLGTNNAFLLDPLTQSTFKIQSRVIPPSERNIDNVVKILKSGSNIIVSVRGSGLFATQSGHFIVLSSVTADGKIHVLDPARRSATGDHSTAVIQAEVINKINSGMWELKGNGTYSSNDNCNTGATGDFISWRQMDKEWGSIKIGTKTIHQVGCLATSVAKLIAYSGTQVTIDNFNPGTMVTYLKQHGGFSGNNWIWNSPKTSGMTPNFQFIGKIRLSGSKMNKIATVKRYLDQGYYLALQVKANGTEEPGQHWVAVLGVSNTDILISDPASDATTVWSRYKPGGTVQFGYYKKTD